MSPTIHLVLSALLGSVLGGGALYKIVLSALENHMRREFQSREDARGMSHRINEALGNLRDKGDRNTGLFVALDDRVGDLEAKAGLLEERQTQQWERIGEQMESTARTLRDVMQEVRAVSDTQHQLALRMERIQSRA